jgi:hypothetical protein
LDGGGKTRSLIVADPWLYLRAEQEAKRADRVDKTPCQQMRDDLVALGGLARRTQCRLMKGIWPTLLGPDREELVRCMAQAKQDVEAMFVRFERDKGDVGPKHASGDSEVA